MKKLMTTIKSLIKYFLQKLRMDAGIQWIKEKWHILMTSNDNPHDIAMGLAIGIFGGIVPIIGLQTILVIGILWFCRRTNYVAAMLSSCIMNQFTIIPILYLDYQVGILFIPPSKILNFVTIKQMFSQNDISQLFYIGKEIFYPMLLGGIICGIFCATSVYGLTVAYLKYRRRRKRHLQ